MPHCGVQHGYAYAHAILDGAHQSQRQACNMQLCSSAAGRQLEAASSRQLDTHAECLHQGRHAHLEEAGLLGQLLDRVAAIPQDALVAINEGDGRFHGGGVE